LPRPVDLLGDIQGQNRRYRRFFSDIDKLRARGAPEQLIQQLQQAGIEALPEIEALTRMNSPMWQKYIAAFNTGQQMIERRTRIELRNQLKLYRKFGSDVGEAIRQGIADREPGLRKEIRSLVLQMFPELKTGGKETRKTSGAGTTNNTTNNYTESHPATYNTDGKGTRSLEAAQARQRRRIRDRSRGGNFGGPANQ
jgi:hypothetical protein